ncbi:hypothetical protein MB901379_00905 [Mycobacterium basiliense]|uniref:Uncharacterized protein n=1 Tax=Mycobacterium basiliense TaxID=2094119 RepID=A0A3S5CZJ5_9MYCO|nr:hypothetical protein MB901379_00905 [Mycobacterium basiliense]
MSPVNPLTSKAHHTLTCAVFRHRRARGAGTACTYQPRSAQGNP